MRRCLLAILPYMYLGQRKCYITVNVRGFGKDMPTSRSYHVIRRGYAHISLSQSTWENDSVDSIKTGLKPVQRCAFNLNPIESQCGQALRLFSAAPRGDLKKHFLLYAVLGVEGRVVCCLYVTMLWLCLLEARSTLYMFMYTCMYFCSVCCVATCSCAATLMLPCHLHAA